jgi:hypothetical protein
LICYTFRNDSLFVSVVVEQLVVTLLLLLLPNLLVVFLEPVGGQGEAIDQREREAHSDSASKQTYGLENSYSKTLLQLLVLLLRAY